VAALGSEPADEELHELRKTAKQARYAAELAERSRGGTASRYIAAAKRLQDVLGEHQDAFDRLVLGEVDHGALQRRQTIEVVARIRTLAKNSPPQKVPLNLNELVTEVLSLIGHEAQTEHVNLQAELADDLPSVVGDRVQLQQVLLNLVLNGMDAMTGVEKRELALTVKTDQSDQGDVVVTVIDRGMGIKPYELDAVFKPFHTTKTANLGMGLAICRSIIEAHGGRLWAESNIGPGTTFKFTLPAGIRPV